MLYLNFESLFLIKIEAIKMLNVIYTQNRLRFKKLCDNVKF